MMRLPLSLFVLLTACSGGIDATVPVDGVGTDSRADAEAPPTAPSPPSHVTDAGVDAAAAPAVATVGAVTGFARVVDDSGLLEVACAKTECYATGVTYKFWRIPNDASASQVNVPWLTRYGGTILPVGDDVFLAPRDADAPPVQAFGVMKRAGASFVAVGEEPFAGGIRALASDGARLLKIGPMSVKSIPVGAGPSDAWAAVGSSLPLQPTSVQGDASGNVFALAGNRVYRLGPGQSVWTEIDVPWASPSELARSIPSQKARLRMAANGDLWISGASFVAKRASATGSWSKLPVDPALGEPGDVVVDGSNVAYFTIGFGPTKPTSFYKLAPGMTAAQKIGSVLSTDQYCANAAIDGKGRLLAACSDYSTNKGAHGLYRSTP